MIQKELYSLLYDYSYLILFGLNFAYFFLLYFGLAPLFNSVCKFLVNRKIAHKIIPIEVSNNQKMFEIKHSLSSIVIFGASIIPIIYLIRIGVIDLLSDTFFNVFIGLFVLILWNECHFFVVHRLMHLPFLFRNVHYIHHQSKVPTVYSVYSFHWFEAFLLSTVPLTIAVFLPFSFISIATYPLVSILINYSGHCNYRFGNGKGVSWLLWGSNHNDHHYKNKKNYGFLLIVFDKMFSKITKSTKSKK